MVGSSCQMRRLLQLLRRRGGSLAMTAVRVDRKQRRARLIHTALCRRGALITVLLCTLIQSSPKAIRDTRVILRLSAMPVRTAAVRPPSPERRSLPAIGNLRPVSGAPAADERTLRTASRCNCVARLCPPWTASAAVTFD